MKKILKFQIFPYSLLLSLTGLVTIGSLEFFHYNNNCNIAIIVKDFESQNPIQSATISLKGERMATTDSNGKVTLNLKSNIILTLTASKTEDRYVSGDANANCSSGNDKVEFHLISNETILKKEAEIEILIQQGKFEEATKIIEGIKTYYPNLEQQNFNNLKQVEQNIEKDIKQSKESPSDINSNIKDEIRYKSLTETEFKQKIEEIKYEDLKKLLKENKNFKKIIKSELRKRKKIKN